jgi:cell division protein FtsL
MPLSAFYDRRAGLWKAMVFLVGIFTAGLSAGATASGLLGVPARVNSLEATADTLQTEIQNMRQDVAELRKSNRIQLCMQIAEKSHTDWRKCLVNAN